MANSNWVSAANRLETEMPDTKAQLINAVAQQRDYVVRLGQYCIEQQQR